MKTKLNVLIVDDDESIRDLFIRILSKECNVITVENGSKAIDLVKEHSFEIAFIDMSMPGLNGSETFIELKKINPNLTGIIMTGFVDKNLRVESFLAGTVKFMNKPFDVSEVNGLIGHEFDLRRERQKKNSKDI